MASIAEVNLSLQNLSVKIDAAVLALQNSAATPAQLDTVKAGIDTAAATLAAATPQP